MFTFRDWWRSKSDAIFEEAKRTGNWHDAFEACWDAAQSAELRRCASLTAPELNWALQLDKATKSGHLRELLDDQQRIDDYLKQSE